jgi:tRNA-2-methylthio-N6-dimethylallyladenosine synthase
MVAYVKAYGCQMNLYDAELIKSIMRDHHYSLTNDENEADIFMLVTCSVRKHAEVRALGRISALRRLKSQKPGRLIVVAGCMAQNLKDQLVTYGADLIVGPDQYRQIPALIATCQVSKNSQTRTEFSLESYDGIIPQADGRLTAFVAIMRGCNNFCSYCIVPSVRGPERSKKSDEIFKEISTLSGSGVKEITLVGQNVLAYNDGRFNFIELIEYINELPGIDHLRFITSHPRDLTLPILERLSRLKKFCPALHLPLQSGSNRILTLMNRGYTKERYLDLVAGARSLLPDGALTTDIIVGFPSESDDDFNETMAVIEKVRFDFGYLFKYSPRAGTHATTMGNDVPETVKQNRLSRLLERQNTITKETNLALLGKTVPVFIEGKNRRDQCLRGRTKNNKIVIINGSSSLETSVPEAGVLETNALVSSAMVGRTIDVVITRLAGWTLIGELKGGQE